ncbi:MAG: amidohydrolase family protein [Chloroflexota bacterium]
MNLDQFFSCPIIDCHIHYPHLSQMPKLLQVCDGLNIERFNIVCTPDRSRLSLVPDALHLKAHHPQRVFVFGGLDVSVYFRAPQQVGAMFAGMLDQLVEAGCDGIKMIEGKPDMRKMLPIPPFDSDAFAPFWEKMAQAQVPLIFHVNDPEEFWDASRIPDWAMQRGWFYGDGTFINNESQYAEIFNLLSRTPNLKVIFAHFFFLSAQFPRLEDLLERYPNVSIDLTPGIEMYRNFSTSIEKTREFFLKYQDRILFGTDIGARALLSSPQTDIELAESRERVTLVRNCLENPGEYHLQPGGGFLFGEQKATFRGLDLPDSVLHKIYHQNFERVVSPSPRPLNPGLIVEMCNQIEMMIQMQGSSQPGVPGDPSVVSQVRSFFESVV